MPDDPAADGLLALGLSITARCPIRCSHCIVEAGPHRREEMDPGFVRRLVRECASAGGGGIQAIIVTGGEPFYAPELLDAALREAASSGLAAAVVTNAFWATSAAAAESTLRRLGGIDLLIVSTDVHHQRFVSLRKIERAIAAARRLSIAVQVAACVDDAAQLDGLLEDLRGIVEPSEVRAAFTLPAGRAGRMPASAAPAGAPIGEGPCTGADFPIVFPDGRAIACMGIVDGLPREHPLSLGNARDRPLAEILREAEASAFVRIMREGGPSALLRALELDGGPALDGTHSHGGCTLCYAMARDGRLLARIRALLASSGESRDRASMSAPAGAAAQEPPRAGLTPPAEACDG